MRSLQDFLNQEGYLSVDPSGYFGSATAQAVTDTGVSVDNPFAESFNRTFKAEEVYLRDYQNLEEAKASIKDFIEKIYNAKRLHSSLGYLPPLEFEAPWKSRQLQKTELALACVH